MSDVDHGNDRDNDDDGGQLQELCAQTELLARKLTGTMRRLSVQAGEYRVEVEWEPTPGAVQAAAGAGGVVTAAAGPWAADPVAEEATAGHPITAPLVGTFYCSPEPGADPFVTEGGQVELGQDVCIVEAMKIMNRVESDVAGTVLEILVADGEVVEYGQVLMIVDLQGGS